MRPITDRCSHKALFFDLEGVYVGSKRLKYKDSVFIYNDQAYNFIPSDSMRFKRVGIFRSTKYYFYVIGDPMPKKSFVYVNPLIHATVYKRIVENKLIKDLNDLAKGSLLEFLFQPKNLLIIIVIIAAIIYFSSGGTLT